MGGCRLRPRRFARPCRYTLLSRHALQLILPTEHLLGDWYGMRSWLEDHGITPTLTFVTDALGNPTGGKRQSLVQ